MFYLIRSYAPRAINPTLLLKRIGAEARWSVIEQMKTSPIINHKWALCDCDEFDGSFTPPKEFPVPAGWQTKYHSECLDGLLDGDF